ncbi:MAG: BrnA antitoxin family protein [Betaproteobacteria bacterium]|nr:BrnA antitoxin family protein [Betaproteobacteria bacterium]
MSLNATAAKKVKFATQLDPDVLETLRRMSADEGRHLQTLLDEALREYIDNKQAGIPRRHVLNALQISMAEYASLYEALAR